MPESKESGAPRPEEENPRVGQDSEAETSKDVRDDQPEGSQERDAPVAVEEKPQAAGDSDTKTAASAAEPSASAGSRADEAAPATGTDHAGHEDVNQKQSNDDDTPAAAKSESPIVYIVGLMGMAALSLGVVPRIILGGSMAAAAARERGLGAPLLAEERAEVPTGVAIV